MKTIYEYFTEQLGERPQDVTLAELPTNSPCGEDCLKAIDAAKNFASIADPCVKPIIILAANQAVEVFWRG